MFKLRLRYPQWVNHPSIPNANAMIVQRQKVSINNTALARALHHVPADQTFPYNVCQK